MNENSCFCHNSHAVNFASPKIPGRLFFTGFGKPAIFSTAGFVVGGNGKLSNGRFNSFDNCVIFWMKMPLKREIKCCKQNARCIKL